MCGCPAVVSPSDGDERLKCRFNNYNFEVLMRFYCHVMVHVIVNMIVYDFLNVRLRKEGEGGEGKRGAGGGRRG